MKAKGSNIFKNIIVIIVYIAFIISVFVYLRTDIKNMNLQKDSLQTVINANNDLIEVLLAEDIQSLTAEQRITRIAIDSLGMTRSKDEHGKLILTNQQIEQIEKIVEQKYE